MVSPHKEPVKEGSEKKELDVGHSTLRVFKASIIPLPPNTPHQARRNNLPNNSIAEATKVTLPASKEPNNRQRHDLTNSK